MVLDPGACCTRYWTEQIESPVTRQLEVDLHGRSPWRSARPHRGSSPLPPSPGHPGEVGGVGAMAYTLVMLCGTITHCDPRSSAPRKPGRAGEWRPLNRRRKRAVSL